MATSARTESHRTYSLAPVTCSDESYPSIVVGHDITILTAIFRACAEFPNPCPCPLVCCPAPHLRCCERATTAEPATGNGNWILRSMHGRQVL